jgi:hypothetical protein
MSEQRSLDENLIRICTRVGSCLSQVEMLTVAAPFCAPSLELMREELREALAAAQAAQRLQRDLVQLIAGPVPQRVVREVEFE